MRAPLELYLMGNGIQDQRRRAQSFAIIIRKLPHF